MYLTCVISKMCFCDGYSFLVINKNTEEKQFIQGDENLVEFFESHYSLPCLFHKLLKNEYVRHNGTIYHLTYNYHPNCQRVKMQLVKGLGVEDPGLWRICPKEYRHLLHDERRQELNKPKKLYNLITVPPLEMKRTDTSINVDNH